MIANNPQNMYHSSLPGLCRRPTPQINSPLVPVSFTLLPAPKRSLPPRPSVGPRASTGAGFVDRGFNALFG